MSDESYDFAAQIAQLARRRQALGLSQEAMAGGLVWALRDVRDVENGVASDAFLQMYHDWLDRLERMPADRQAENVKQAGHGKKFTP